MATRRQPAQPEGLKTALSASQLDRIILGDALEVLRELPDASVDAIVTDPPAGISFMGKGWDSDKGGRDAWIVWLAEVMREALRVVKPGGHALVWALPRTSHWTAMALEDAGWEIRERIAHINGQGFPKSLDVSKAIDKAAGAQREVVRSRITPHTTAAKGFSNEIDERPWMTAARERGYHEHAGPTPATDAARQWEGWGTALKPAVEDWWLVRKPLSEPTVAANVLRWGTGALNIGASRVGTSSTPRKDPHNGNLVNAHMEMRPWMQRRIDEGLPLKGDFTGEQGRWPANLLLSHAEDCLPGACSLWCPVRELDAQSGVRESRPGKTKPTARSSWFTGQYSDGVSYPGDTGGASRFFSTFRYQAKAGRAERNRGCEGLPFTRKGVMADDAYTRPRDGKSGDNARVITGNTHCCVKPLALMSWLIALITPSGGIVLDPFAGSGSTLCAAKAGGWRYIGVEREAEYVAIAEARLAAADEPGLGSATLIERPKPAKPKRERKPAKPTQPLWEMRA